MDQPEAEWALDLRAPRSEGYALAEALGFDELVDALSVSIFDDGPAHVQVQALYAARSEAEAARATLPGTIEAAISRLPDTDWVSLSQSGLPPVRAGRFAVHGSHDDAPDGAVFPIRVDAGLAFGTGHHGTTIACLTMLDDLEARRFRPGAVLDLGTGTGLLAIAAAKLWPDAEVLATDIDADAVAVSLDNAEANGVQFDCVLADGFDTEALRGRSFALVIANILAGPLRDMAGDIAAAVAPGGHAVLSGILDRQAEWVADAFRAHGLKVALQPSVDGWTSLLATKP